MPDLMWTIANKLRQTEADYRFTLSTSLLAFRNLGKLPSSG